MMAADIRPSNRPMPARTRAMVRSRYARRAKRGTILLATDRIPIFALGAIIGELVQRRLDLGVSTEDIEHRAGIADNHLAKVESGAKTPSLDLFLLLVETMGGEVTVRWKGKR